MGALKGRGGGGVLVTGFSNIDYLRTGNQQQKSGRSGYQLFHHWLPVYWKPAAMQKWFREKIHLVAVAGQNHYFKDGLLFEAVWINTSIKSSSNYWWQMTNSNENLFLKMQQ